MIVRQFDPAFAGPRVSVLIGLVSTEDCDRIFETLESLSSKQSFYACEVIVADRRNDRISAAIADRFPNAYLVQCAPYTTLPELRTIALERSTGDIVAVMEDHCVPAEDWLKEIDIAFTEAPPGTVAVGGCVENAVRNSGLDWATFICEYSFFSPPVEEGETRVLPGMNVAYRRQALAGVPRDAFTSGFWETTVHPLLLQHGGRFFSRNAIKMYHCKKFSLSLFASQRYVYSRYFGGIRFARNQWLRRWVAAAASLFLPAVLLFRMWVQATGAKRLNREFTAAMPTLLLFIVIWSVGEMVGYLFGAGDALAKIE